MYKQRSYEGYVLNTCLSTLTWRKSNLRTTFNDFINFNPAVVIWGNLQFYYKINVSLILVAKGNVTDVESYELETTKALNLRSRWWTGTEVNVFGIRSSGVRQSFPKCTKVCFTTAKGILTFKVSVFWTGKMLTYVMRLWARALQSVLKIGSALFDDWQKENLNANHISAL